jgi:hypothetical protein
MRQMARNNASRNMPILLTLVPEGHVFGTYNPLPNNPAVWVPKEYTMLQSRLKKRVDDFEATQRELFTNADPSSPSFHKWIEPSISLDIYRGTGLPRWNNTLSYYVIIFL